MPVSDYVNYSYMQDMVEEVMLSSAQRLIYNPDHDVFGGEVPNYTPAEVYKCGFQPIRTSEQPSFTGVVVKYDAKVRLPVEAKAVLQQRDLLRITIGTLTEDYEIVGPIVGSQFTMTAEVARVQI